MGFWKMFNQLGEHLMLIKQSLNNPFFFFIKSKLDLDSGFQWEVNRRRLL